MKVLMIIPFRDFRDEEYFILKEILKSVETASDSLGTAIGKLGGEVEIDLLLDKVDVKNYDAVIFVGGSGANKYIDNEVCHKIARQAVNQNKILGGICIAPLILAKAGVLKNKKVTVWSSSVDKSAVRILKESGAVYENKGVVIDGNIITADGPESAEDFAKSIIYARKH